MKIDIALTYVDGSAPGFQDAHARHAGPVVPCQVRDNGELRYALRAIDRHMPWVNQVFLIVKDTGQIPAWLNPDALQVVLEESFIPRPLLPIFHMAPVQAHLHCIEGLSETFLLWSDDFFLGRDLSPADFFDAAGQPKTGIYDSPVGDWQADTRRSGFTRRMANTRRVLNSRLPDGAGPSRMSRRWGHYLYPHMPVAVRKSWWREMMDHYFDHPDVHLAISQKTRDDPTGQSPGVYFDQLYVNWVELTKTQRAVGKKGMLWLLRQLQRASFLGANRLLGSDLPALYAIYKLRNDPTATAASMNRLKRERPTFFCVNDDGYDRYDGPDGVWHTQYALNPASIRLFQETMQALYPDPSRYEIAMTERP